MNLMPHCQRVAQNVSAARDGQLHGWARIITLLHLALCGPCRRYARDIDQIYSALQSAHQAQRAEGLSASAKQHVHDRVDQEDAER
ncbi:MAG TPA: hypothetical protein VMV40_03865 [Acidiferrobacter sp.]|nr:hypothetical protein [Acidiferrobacter sp.]